MKRVKVQDKPQRQRRTQGEGVQRLREHRGGTGGREQHTGTG